MNMKKKKEIIQKDWKELQKYICPKYEQIAVDLEIQLANLDGVYEKITIGILKQGKEWHKEIDIVINKMKTEINEIKTNQESILKKLWNEIKQIQPLIKPTLIALVELEQSAKMSAAIEYISEIRNSTKLPTKVNVMLPTFIPKPIDHENLLNFFGQIIPTSTATQEYLLSLN